MSVPKERFFTRPGSILRPADRIMYQAVLDNVMEQLEEGHDRSRSFSHVPSDEDEQMFEPNHRSWERFQHRIAEICDESEFVLKADISNYFERLPQHNLVNLMSAAGCAPEMVGLLEEMLLAFRERGSSGIIQGVYPSDALGNFYLSALDAHCELDEIPSARYVDDIYMGFPSEVEARKGLASLIETLPKDGLHLNEHKSKIMPADEVIREETAVDRLSALLDHPRGTRMPSVAIYGDSGMGKTMIMKRFRDKHPTRFNAVTGTLKTPVLAMEMTSRPGERRFYAELLCARGHSRRPRRQGN